MPPVNLNEALSDAITHWAPALRVPPGMNAAALLKALAAQETTDATRIAACKHENAYCYGGSLHSDAPSDWAWGCAAHCSWSPWQIMFTTARMHGYADDPVGLRDPMVAGEYVVQEINRVLDEPGATTDEVFRAWNGGFGRRHDETAVVAYVKSATDLYTHFVAQSPPVSA